MVKKADRHDRWRNTFYGRVFLTLAKHLENDRQADLTDYVWILKQELNCLESQIIIALSTASKLGWVKRYKISGRRRGLQWAVAITQQGWKAIDDQPALWGPEHITPSSGQDAWKTIQPYLDNTTVTPHLVAATAPFSSKENTVQENFLRWTAEEIVRQQQPVIFDYVERLMAVSGRSKNDVSDSLRLLRDKGLASSDPFSQCSICLTAYGWVVLGREQPPTFPLQDPIRPQNWKTARRWLVALRFIATQIVARADCTRSVVEASLDKLLAGNPKTDRHCYGRLEVERLRTAGLLVDDDSHETMIIADLGWQFLGPRPLVDWQPTLLPSVKVRRQHLTDRGHQLRYLSALADIVTKAGKEFIGVERWPALVERLGVLQPRLYQIEMLVCRANLIERRLGRGLKISERAIRITPQGWRLLGLPQPRLKKNR